MPTADLPDARRADITPPSFSFAVEGQPGATRHWWQAFNDPHLEQMVVTGLRTSTRIAAADQRILSARANAERVGVRTAPGFNGGAAIAQPAGADNVSVTSSASITLDLDTSGQRRREQDRALIALSDAIAERDEEVLALAGAIARTVVRSAANAERLRLANASIRRGETLVETLQTLVASGDATQIDLLRARASLLDDRATSRRLVGEASALTQELAALVGGGQGLVTEFHGNRGVLALTVNRFPTAVPADAIRARPDIRRIELQYDAARVRVRDAEAERLPRLSLSGTIDASGSGLGWRFGPSITLPALSARERNAAVEREVSAAQAILFDWEAAVISGASEVEIALARVRAGWAQLEELQLAKAQYDEALRLADQLFEEGQLTLQERLDLEESRADSSLALIVAREAYHTAFIDLHLALGVIPET